MADLPPALPQVAAQTDLGMPETGTPRRPALSPSRAGDFKQCPLKYRLRAVDRIPETRSRAAVRGTVVHAALEALYGLPAAERVPERASALVDPAWAQLVEESPDLADLVEAEERTKFLDEARALITRYYRLEDPTRFDPQSCELRVETELDDGVLLRGFVDRIDVAPTGEVRIVDYKTGRVPGEMREAKALFQMKFYALVILRMRGIVPSELRLLYLADDAILTYAPDEDELRRFERTLSAIWKAILAAGVTGDFRPSPGRLCDWCDYKEYCPSFGGTPPPYPGWPETFGTAQEQLLEEVSE